MSKLRTYSELMALSSFESRFDYVALFGQVGSSTFGFDRYLNQQFYTSREWRNFRDYIITRDCGCDLAIKDLPIVGTAIVHHMNPLTVDQVEHSNPCIMDPELVILVSDATHRAIHYGYTARTDPRQRTWQERRPNDTVPWKR